MKMNKKKTQFFFDDDGWSNGETADILIIFVEFITIQFLVKCLRDDQI